MSSQEQETGVRSQESGVRSQESGVRSQESGVGSRESGVGSRESGAGSREPGVGTPRSGVTESDQRISDSLIAAISFHLDSIQSVIFCFPPQGIACELPDSCLLSLLSWWVARRLKDSFNS